jgi:hypothetical protein
VSISRTELWFRNFTFYNAENWLRECRAERKWTLREIIRHYDTWKTLRIEIEKIRRKQGIICEEYEPYKMREEIVRLAETHVETDVKNQADQILQAFSQSQVPLECMYPGIREDENLFLDGDERVVNAWMNVYLRENDVQYLKVLNHKPFIMTKTLQIAAEYFVRRRFGLICSHEEMKLQKEENEKWNEKHLALNYKVVIAQSSSMLVVLGNRYFCGCRSC